MTRLLASLALLGLLFFTSACSKTEKVAETLPVDEGLVLEYDAAEMEKAVATARTRVGEFITALAKGDAESYSVNVPISDVNGSEQFWVGAVTYKDGQFTGRIGNDPEIVQTVKNGQAWTASQEEISDWMFTVDGKIHGGFTIDPLLATYPKEEADALRAKLVR